ncbi:hypothetical protein KI659_14980 [Litoribacter alkaliphilus]|uniref:Uncharacterized protein n=1 Tax=Litoribacter ruber TaxID=702568 RepID=A0AAP2G5Q2_9BACT|nr:DUF6266 family protein [Litoribacter alkaliphilus]MBS9525321.1 hypothetical protein [Litoribacter alkaliphilus]
MGRLNSNNGMSGRIGKIVYYQVDGQTMARAHVVPDQSNPSPLQLASRRRFAEATAFTKYIKPVLELGFANHQKGKRHALNAAFSNIRMRGFIGESTTLDPSLVAISDGTLTGMRGGKVYWKNNETAVVEWEDNTGFGTASARDKVAVLLYDTVKRRAFYILEGNPRSAKRQEIKVEDFEYHEGNLHVYAFFTNKAGRTPLISESTYLDLI